MPTPGQVTTNRPPGCPASAWPAPAQPSLHTSIHSTCCHCPLTHLSASVRKTRLLPMAAKALGAKSSLDIFLRPHTSALQASRSPQHYSLRRRAPPQTPPWLTHTCTGTPSFTPRAWPSPIVLGQAHPVSLPHPCVTGTHPLTSPQETPPRHTHPPDMPTGPAWAWAHSSAEECTGLRGQLPGGAAGRHCMCRTLVLLEGSSGQPGPHAWGRDGAASRTIVYASGWNQAALPQSPCSI